MPVLADPGFAYSQKNPLDTFRETASIMERKQEMRQREQAMAMQQQAQELNREKWNVEKSVLQAKANADILSYGFDLTDRKAVEEYRAKAATAAVELGNKYREVIQLKDWNAQNTALKGLQQEYGWLGRFDQFAPMLNSVNTSRTEAVSNILTEQKLQDTLEIKKQEAEMRNQYLLDAQRQREQARADEAAARREDAASQRAINSPEAKAAANAAVKANQAADEAAELARKSDAQIAVIENLYSRGAQSGFYTGLIPKVVMNPTALLGNPSAQQEVGLQQQLEMAIKGLNLERRREVNKGTGAISDSENAYLYSASPSLSNTKEANLEYFNFLKKLNARVLELDSLTQQWRSEGVGPTEIYKRRVDWTNKHPIPIPTDSGGSASTTPSTADQIFQRAMSRRKAR